MPFLRVTDGVTTIDLDVSHTGATERVPDRIGGAARSFSGKWRSDELEFQSWDFSMPLMPQATYVTFRNLVKGGKLVTVSGDAIGAAIAAMVRINEARYSDDKSGPNGFSRDVTITVFANVAS
jgi:hypothetical protein